MRCQKFAKWLSWLMEQRFPTHQTMYLRRIFNRPCLIAQKENISFHAGTFLCGEEVITWSNIRWNSSKQNHWELVRLPQYSHYSKSPDAIQLTDYEIKYIKYQSCDWFIAKFCKQKWFRKCNVWICSSVPQWNQTESHPAICTSVISTVVFDTWTVCSMRIRHFNEVDCRINGASMQVIDKEFRITKKVAKILISNEWQFLFYIIWRKIKKLFGDFTSWIAILIRI